MRLLRRVFAACNVELHDAGPPSSRLVMACRSMRRITMALSGCTVATKRVGGRSHRYQAPPARPHTLGLPGRLSRPAGSVHHLSLAVLHDLFDPAVVVKARRTTLLRFVAKHASGNHPHTGPFAEALVDGLKLAAA